MHDLKAHRFESLNEHDLRIEIRYSNLVTGYRNAAVTSKIFYITAKRKEFIRIKLCIDICKMTKTQPTQSE